MCLNKSVTQSDVEMTKSWQSKLLDADADAGIEYVWVVSGPAKSSSKKGHQHCKLGYIGCCKHIEN